MGDSRRVILPVFGITAIVLIIVFVLAVTGFFHRPIQGNETAETTTIEIPVDPGNGAFCRGSSCKNEASRLRRSLNPQVNPCDDFHAFTCGNYNQTIQVPQYAAAFGSIEQRNLAIDELYHAALMKNNDNDSRPVKFIKSAYQKCVEEKYDPKLEEVLKSIGKKIPRNTLIDLIGSGESVFLKLDVLPHPTNSTVYALWIDRPDFTIDVSVLRSMKDANNTLSSLIESYRTYTQQVLARFYQNGEQLPRANSVIALESYLAMASLDQATYNDWRLSLETLTLGQLDSRTHPSFKWKQFLRKISHTSGSKVVVDDDTPIVVRDMSYLKAFSSILVKSRLYPASTIENDETFTVETLNNYFKFYLINTYQFMVNKTTVQNEFEFLSKLRSHNQIVNYSPMSRCLNLLRLHAPELVGRVFVQSLDLKKNSNIKGIGNMSISIREQFVSAIDKSSKMSANTKAILTRRLNAMKITSLYPNWIMNDTILEKWFLFEDHPNCDGFIKFQSLKHSRSKYKLDRLIETVTKADILPSYSESPGVFYDARFNFLIIPASLMTGHYYNSSLPPAVNYATVGVVIAHKMAHAIDLNSLSFDERGNFLPLDSLDKDLLNDLNNSLSCFQKQMSSILYETINFHLNGSLTKVEDASDQLAIQMAVNAYATLNDSKGLGFELSNFNAWQQFYLAYGNYWCQMVNSTESLRVTVQRDGHSPRKFRSSVPVVNTEHFLQIFNCSSDAYEDLKPRCHFL